jgi:hypothetical protein
MVTFVSLLPFPIREDMPHINPSRYELEAAPKDGFSILHINNATDYVYAGDGKHVDRIVLAKDIAENLRQMVAQSQMSIGENASPGIFIVDGHLSKGEVAEKFGTKLKVAQIQQRNWFKNLVKEADDTWGKFRQHRTISDLHRYACGALALQREWNIDMNTETGPVFCPACSSPLINADVTVCATCHTIIKPEEHAKRFGKVAVMPHVGIPEPLGKDIVSSLFHYGNVVRFIQPLLLNMFGLLIV